MKKYAVFGGSFDPVHFGHLGLAEAAVREAQLDRLIFVPNRVSPFKEGKTRTSAEDRCRMLEAVMDRNEAFALSRDEVDRQEPSYTVNTLRRFRERLEGELSFVLGYDALLTLDTWFRGEEILREYDLITGRRPDTADSAAEAKIAFFRQRYGAKIRVLTVAPMDFSSTEIRDRAAKGHSLAGLVAPKVEEYIIKHGLYRDENA